MKVLVIGGGFSGMSAAIELRKRQVEVDLAEIDEGWRAYGAGISIGGATLRALGTLGVLDAFLEHGCAIDGVEIFTQQGHPLASVPTPRLAGADVPGAGAIMRPALARILSQATRAAGAQVRLGCSFQALRQDAEGVEVTFTDGSQSRYDLVIGADGLYSAVRASLFPDAAQPAYTGQGVWRAVLARPPALRTTRMWVGPHIKAGINPVSPEQMYLFVTEDRAEPSRVPPEQFVAQLRALLEPFGAPEVQAVRAELGEGSQILYRPLESLLLERPWYQGRVVLIGDAVHATTPHLASGACIGIEDGIVLAEELGRGQALPSALQAFQARRWERCRMVVHNSLRLGQIEIAGGDKQEHAALMRQSMDALAQAI